MSTFPATRLRRLRRTGALVALPLLAVGRAIWEFFADRVTLEPWSDAEPVPVELVEPRTIEKS